MSGVQFNLENNESFDRTLSHVRKQTLGPFNFWKNKGISQNKT
jgi:hypothetical protein